MNHTTEAALGALFAARPEVDCAVLFGSAACGRLGPDSDIDIYVRLGAGAHWSIAERIQIADALTERAQRDVDLVVEEADTSVILRREVAARGRPLYAARPQAWTELRARAMLAYADLEPYMRRIADSVFRAVGQRG